jgi:hypothetical protein
MAGITGPRLGAVEKRLSRLAADLADIIASAGLSRRQKEQLVVETAASQLTWARNIEQGERTSGKYFATGIVRELSAYTYLQYIFYSYIKV